jgi:hypothetical protein
MDCLVTIGSLLGHIRNGLSHGRLRFSTDSQKLEEVVIEFKDQGKDKESDQVYKWSAEIQGDDLYNFCHYVLHLLSGPSANVGFDPSALRKSRNPR